MNKCININTTTILTICRGAAPRPGLALHSVLNGVALAAAVGHGSDDSRLAGLGTFLVIFLHKPFDAMTIGMLMAHGGWSLAWRHTVNALFSLGDPSGRTTLLFRPDERSGRSKRRHAATMGGLRPGLLCRHVPVHLAQRFVARAAVSPSRPRKALGGTAARFVGRLGCRMDGSRRSFRARTWHHGPRSASAVDASVRKPRHSHMACVA